MKKLLLIFTFAIFFMSCNEKIDKVENPAASTSMEISMAEKDTVLLYKYSEETYYIVNKDTSFVEYKLYSNNTNTTTMLVMIIITGVICMVVGYQMGKEAY